MANITILQRWSKWDFCCVQLAHKESKEALKRSSCRSVTRTFSQKVTKHDDSRVEHVFSQKARRMVEVGVACKVKGKMWSRRKSRTKKARPDTRDPLRSSGALTANVCAVGALEGTSGGQIRREKNSAKKHWLPGNHRHNFPPTRFLY